MASLSALWCLQWNDLSFSRVDLMLSKSEENKGQSDEEMNEAIKKDLSNIFTSLGLVVNTFNM